MASFYCWDVQKRTEWWIRRDATSFTIGGSARADVPLPDRSLGAFQLRVSRGVDGRCMLNDMRGDERTQLNGTFLKKGFEVALVEGDTIRVGCVQLRYFSDARAFEDDARTKLKQPPEEMPQPPADLDILPTPSFLLLCAASVAVGVCLGIILGIVVK